MTKLLTPVEVIQALENGKEVEVKFGDDYDWEYVLPNQMIIDELINPEHQFRLPPQFICIDDIEFPKPETEPLVNGTTYYTPDISNIDTVYNLTWHNDFDDQRFLQYGIVHLTEENAIAHAKALIKLSGGTYE